MDYGIIYFIIFAVIMIVIYQNKRVNNNRAKEILTELESEFPKSFKVNGEVKFSKLRKLLDVNLKISHTQNDIIISGFDYYNDRQTTFIFYNNKDLNSLTKLAIPKYLISSIKILENDKIIIESGEKIKITLNYKKYGKEKLELKEIEFDKLIRKLNKNYLQHRV
ncbi:hypothetical protein [Winogradskyella bathintestinalis]|uniref:Uncharacterized protein n=1 Tax=Winogradskyella bathintestinalis TaxID=3035208 RepID=A0ABT7ZZ33_9FLAO|nr:hypothetical protein [Winogradskyella bathintestinalis]MDN3494268.1 hypothetical protein [Winogradskyella bathintestinalis]